MRAAVLIGLVLIAGCRGRTRPTRAAAPRPVPAAPAAPADSPSMQYLPRLEQAEGWRLEGDPRVFAAASVPAHLGADARHFLLYELTDLTVGQYRRTDGAGFATVEIFRFPDFIKAFGAYSTRRLAPAGFLDISNEGFVGSKSIHIWRGPFYVRMVGGGPPGTLEAMKRLAAAVTEPIPPAPGRPAVFGFMPADPRVANSEMFVAERALGQPYFSHAFMARFNVGGDMIDGMILPARDRSAAAALLNRFRAFFVTNGRLLDPVPNLGEDNFTGEDRTFGRAAAFRLDRFVIVFRSYGPRQTLVDLSIDTNQRILGTIRRQLQAIDSSRQGDDTDQRTASAPWQR